MTNHLTTMKNKTPSIKLIYQTPEALRELVAQAAWVASKQRIGNAGPLTVKNFIDDLWEVMADTAWDGDQLKAILKPASYFAEITGLPLK